MATASSRYGSTARSCTGGAGRNRSWIVVGDRLLEAAVIGRAVGELDLRSGRVVAELGNLGPWLSNMPAPKRPETEWVTL